MESETIKTVVEEQLQSQIGGGVEVRFIEDGDRVDVRITDLGVERELESTFENISVTTYSDYRFTIRLG